MERNSVDEQLRSLTALVGELRHENAELRQQVRELRGDVGYWKSRHADAVERNTKLKAELDEAQAEIRQLKAERFGKQSEKQSATDRSNDLDDPQQQATPKKKRGQQSGRPAPKRRDYSHLPVREAQVDCPTCGVKVEKVPWCDGKNQLTTTYRWFLAGWAQRLCWKGVVEGFNNKVKLTTRKSYGFRTYEAIETALYHNLGALPEPEFTHRFW